MNVKDLRKLLEGVPDDYLVLVPGGDHSFSLADVVVGSAEKQRHVQYHLPQYTENVFDAPVGGNIVGAVIVS